MKLNWFLLCHKMCKQFKHSKRIWTNQMFERKSNIKLNIKSKAIKCILFKSTNLMICDFNSYIPRERTLGLKFLKGLKDFRWVRKLYGAILLWGCSIDWHTDSPLLSPLEAYLFQTHCRLSLSTHVKMPTAQATIFSRADLWVLRGTYPFFCEICIISQKFSIKYVVSNCSNIW